MRREPTQDPQQLWGATLKLMESQVSQATYQTCLRNAQPLSLTDDTLTLKVPHNFVKDVLERQYRPIIDAALSSVAGTPLRFSVEVESSQLGLPLGAGRTHAAEDSIESAYRPIAQESVHIPKTPDRTSENQFKSIPLNPKYTFDRFVAGRNNELTHAAAWSVAQHPADTNNPLFIYGGVGLGKTHIMHAIGHQVRESLPDLKVACVSGETFLYHVVTAIREDTMGEFRRAYRSVDVWLVDDVQLIASRERTEVEFFHIFNELYNTNRQIVVCSDRPPKELNLIEPRLRSRFEWGLITDMGVPDLEHRIAILQRKANDYGLVLPEEATLYIAEVIQSNIRVLEGALTRIAAHTSLRKEAPSLDLIKNCLRDYSETQPQHLSIKDIQQVVAAHFDVAVDELGSKRRNRLLVAPRHLAMYLSRELTDESFPDIGDAFHRDHSSVLYAHRKIRQEMAADPSLVRLVGELKSKASNSKPSDGAVDDL